MRLSPAIALLALLGCGSFPVSLYVDDAALEELRRSRYDERVDADLLRARVAERTGLVLAQLPPTAPDLYRLDVEPARRVDSRAASSVGSPVTADLRPGDLLLVKNPKAQSLGTKLSFAAFAFHDHLGILVREGRRWCVVESAPSFHALGRYPDFAARFQGRVRRVSLGSYLRRYEVLTVVRLPDAELARGLADDAMALRGEHIRFDPYHDPARPELSCTELVQELLARRGAPWWPPPVPVTRNPSMLRVMHAVGFRLPGYVLPDLVLTYPGARVVARFSRHPSSAEARAYELAYRVLWERHEPHGLAGDLIAPHGWSFVRLRARTALFLGLARAVGRAVPDAGIAELRAAVTQAHDVVLAAGRHAEAGTRPRTTGRPRRDREGIGRGALPICAGRGMRDYGSTPRGARCEPSPTARLGPSMTVVGKRQPSGAPVANRL